MRTTTRGSSTSAARPNASNLLTFLFLSLLIFSFRTLVENGTHLLTSFIDRDPSLNSLLSASSRSPPSYSSSPSPITLRRPFLHLTRVGTLDDDPARKAPIFIFSHFTSPPTSPSPASPSKPKKKRKTRKAAVK